MAEIVARSEPVVLQAPPVADAIEDAPVPLSAQEVGTSFLATQLSESGVTPPDSSGAVGPTQVMVVSNGRIKLFDKAGNLSGLDVCDTTFFDAVRDAACVRSPHVRYDRLSGRWFITEINVANTSNRILIAVSSGSTITSASSFTFYQFSHDLVGPAPNSDTGHFADASGWASTRTRSTRPSFPDPYNLRMRNGITACSLVLIALALESLALVHSGARAEGSYQRVTVTRNDAARRVDVVVGGKPFTSYIFPNTIKKPVLFPLRTAKGTVVTRGFPLEPRPGERADHPHQVGAWFTYGDVNGIDFWGYSDATPREEVPQKGTIVHKAITRTLNGADRGELAVTADWVMPDGSTILQEETLFIFRGDDDSRSVDRVTRWAARDKRIVFNDTKEGAFGIRVARSLEQPSKEPEIFTDGRGRAETVPKLDNTGVTGLYRSSDGKTGDDVWGTRARWMMLTGTVEREPVTLAILDHPLNPGYPTYWHARGYGLFAANPLGQGGFTNGKERMNLTLEPGKSITFRHRILVLSGTAAPERIESEYKEFVR